MYNSQDVAKRVKRYAKIKNIPLSKMLFDCELGKNTMSNFKSSMPKADNLAKIADYLGCSVDYLLGRTDKTDNSITVSNVNNSNGNIGHSSKVIVNSHDALSGMEQDLIKIFRSSNGKTQMKIMQFIYDLENIEE